MRVWSKSEYGDFKAGKKVQKWEKSEIKENIWRILWYKINFGVNDGQNRGVHISILTIFVISIVFYWDVKKVD